MELIANGIRQLALVVWVGSVLFFTLVVAPLLFQSLPPEEAGRAVSAIFPSYYAVGAVCAVLLLIVDGRELWAGRAASQVRKSVWIVGLMLACTLYAGLVVLPRAADAKLRMRGDDESATIARAEFRSAHGLSMGLNGIVLLGGVALVALSARRRSE